MKLKSKNEGQDGQENLNEEEPVVEADAASDEEAVAESASAGDGVESDVETDESDAENEAPEETALDENLLEDADEEVEAEEADADQPDEVTVSEPTSENGEPVPDDADDQEPGQNDEQVEADVEFEGDRPLVKELVYQAPRGKQTAEEQEESESVKFGSVGEAKTVVEGFLFSCNEPLTVNKLSKLMNNLHPKTVRGLLLELQWDYENRPGALQIVEIAGGYQMCTRAHVAPWMFRMHKHKRRSALSPATLETLAIVAYRQPITKGEIETIRGVESGAPLRTLQDLSLVEASGRREVIGRPQLYITTEQFLKTFGLKSVADLPSISELKNRFAEETKLKRVVAEEPKPEAAPDADAGETPADEGETTGEDGSLNKAVENVDGEDTEGLSEDTPAADEETAESEGAESLEIDDDLDLDEDLDIPEEDINLVDQSKKNAQGRFEEEDSLDIP